jgi:hypothetical protein
VEQAPRIGPSQGNKFGFAIPWELLQARDSIRQLYPKVHKVLNCLDAIFVFHGYFTFTETIDPSGATVIL